MTFSWLFTPLPITIFCFPALSLSTFVHLLTWNKKWFFHSLINTFLSENYFERTSKYHVWWTWVNSLFKTSNTLKCPVSRASRYVELVLEVIWRVCMLFIFYLSIADHPVCKHFASSFNFGLKSDQTIKTIWILTHNLHVVSIIFTLWCLMLPRCIEIGQHANIRSIWSRMSLS